MNIEQKAKAYDEAINAIKELKAKHPTAHVIKDWIKENFPELAESEDEKIRKALIDYFNDFNLQTFAGLDPKKILYWLEKQGESTDINPSEFDLRLNKLLKQFETLPKKELVNCLSFYLNVVQNDGTYREEKRGEQKPADKVKPKFKVGDWITMDGWNYHIDEVLKSCYNLSDINGNYTMLPHFAIDDYYRPWIIQDAKDGDMLFTSSTASHETFILKSIDEKGNAKCYFAYDSEDGFREGKYHFIGSATNCKPATKEQRDLLFQKMHEAGYEWDSEKKELKKIEQYFSDKYKDWYDFIRWFVKQRTNDYTLIPSNDDIHKWGDNILNHARKVLEQNTVEWSEEDERHLNNIINRTIAYGDSSIYGLIKDDIAWLRSLIPQSQWKPSDEQIKGIECAIKTLQHQLNVGDKRLNSLYDDLKKLKG